MAPHRLRDTHRPPSPFEGGPRREYKPWGTALILFHEIFYLRNTENRLNAHERKTSLHRAAECPKEREQQSLKRGRSEPPCHQRPPREKIQSRKSAYETKR